MNYSYIFCIREFIVCTQLNGFKYCYLTLIILLNINDLFAHSEMVSRIII